MLKKFFDKLSKNIGKVMQKFAVVMFVVNVIAGIGLAIFLSKELRWETAPCFFIFLGLVLVAAILFMFFFGVGRLVENSEVLATDVKRKRKKAAKSADAEASGTDNL